MIWKVFKWMALAVFLMVVVIIGAVMSEVTVEVLHIYGIGNGTCGNTSGYVVGCIIGYVVCKNGWL